LQGSFLYKKSPRQGLSCFACCSIFDPVSIQGLMN
jgi:hypothetical protein